MAALIPDKKCGVWLGEKLEANAAAYYPGLVMPSSTDGVPLLHPILGRWQSWVPSPENHRIRKPDPAIFHPGQDLPLLRHLQNHRR